MKIEGKITEELEVKRFYIPGIVIYDNCPECGELAMFSGRDKYLSYPVANGNNTVWFVCGNEDCEHDWTNEIFLEINIKDKSE